MANQLDRYKAQLDRRAEEIVSAYQAYVRAIKLLFDTSAVEQMQEPVKIDTSGAVLLLFGYDKKQQPKIKELEKYGGMEGKLLRKRSSLSGATASLIWRAVQAL